MFLYLLGISRLFILFRLLCLEWPFYILVVCGSFYCGGFNQWVGLDDWLVEVSWLGKLCQCSGAWRWISSLWSAMECLVMSFAMGLCVRCDFGQPVC